MKALVLSGGSGTRLRPFSHSMPKQLIPIANKPVLEHVLENIRELGITDIGVVVGDRGAEIAAGVGDGSRLGVRLTYLQQDRPRGLAHTVVVAREFLGEEDFVMYLGDNMLPEGVRSMAEDFEAERPDAQIVVHRVADPRAFGVAELGPEGEVLRLVEKPAEPKSDLALVGVYFFTPAIHRAVAAIEPSKRGELEITDAIQWLVADGARVRASEYEGYWKDTGEVDDVLECNSYLLQRLKPSVRGEVDAESVLTGSVVVEDGARVERSRIEGPAIVAAGSLVEDSDIGPDTTIGRDCLVRGALLESTIALEGASLVDVRGMHGSIIGRGASVGPADGGSDQHRMVVGDHTRVEFVA
ncbi:glucose-1-phosphate thymidylyltransferase [Streptomyces sp. NPDC055189]